MFQPLDFLARLASVVPNRRVNLTRFHGLFAPHSSLRAKIAPCPKHDRQNEECTTHRRTPMTWTQRLKRVFGIDIHLCEHCAGTVKIAPAFTTRSSSTRSYSTDPQPKPSRRQLEHPRASCSTNSSLT